MTGVAERRVCDLVRLNAPSLPIGPPNKSSGLCLIFLPNGPIRSRTSPYIDSYNSPTEKDFCLFRPIVRDASTRCGAGRYPRKDVIGVSRRHGEISNDPVE